jgi:DNA-binding CsgD family transcriptional regulator
MIKPLRGREPELATLRTVLSGSRQRGGVIAVRGAAGIGKSALLDAARDIATGNEMDTVTLVAVQGEVRPPFAAAHQLLARFGAAPPADTGNYSFRLGRTLLEVLTLRAAAAPLAVLVDDAHWLDQASWEALAFAGRRLAADPVVLVLALRDGREADERLAGLPAVELPLEPLGLADANAVLDDTAPGLSSESRARVLDEAAGNPLALVELAGRDGHVPSSLPLVTRLERTFALTVAGLPPATREMLLVAALDDGDRLDEVLTAAGTLIGGPVTVADVEPAIDARLIDVDASFRVHFRHPLVRSAIRHAAGLARRSRAHRALAAAANDPDRALAHRAAATAGTDEEVCGELDELAGRLHRRGATAEAAALWERSAQLTAAPARRAALLLRAVDAATEVADHDRAERVLRAIVAADLSHPDRTVLRWLDESRKPRVWTGVVPLFTHLAAARRLHRTGRDERALNVLHRVALRAFFSDPPGNLRAEMLALLDDLDLPPLTPRLVATVGFVAPSARGALVTRQLDELSNRFDLGGVDLQALAAAANGVGALPAAVLLGDGAVALNRRQGNLSHLSWSLAHRAWTAVRLGDAVIGREAAAEAETLVGEARQQRYVFPVRAIRAHAEALRGSVGEAAALAAEAERGMLAGGETTLLCYVRAARGVAALAGGRYAEAVEEFDALFEPTAAGYHPYVRFSVLAHLAEAALLAGTPVRARRRIEEMAEIDAGFPSLELRVGLHCAQALLAPDMPPFSLAEWPFERARLHLARGTLLRRHDPGQARPLLRAAADVFDSLGARPWADRAHAELRAAGESRRRPAHDIDRLTPQELQVARLVADGLTNREIAERMFLSPRTIGTHLYRIYPKLDVSTRTELAAVMIRQRRN